MNIYNRRPWTSNEEGLLRLNYPTRSVDDLASLFPGRTGLAIKARAKLLGLKKKRKRFCFTTAQIDYLVKNYSTMLSQDIAEKFGCSLYSIYTKAYSLGLKKASDFSNSPMSGRIQKGQKLSTTTQFKPGHTPFNKGRKLEEFLSPEKIEKMKTHQFKPGHKPYNTGKNGEIRWRHHPGYYFIRQAENKWEFLHRYLWEQKHGPVPKGYNIIFKDGNRRNCTMANLECISNAELAEGNRHTKYPSEIRKAIELNNKLEKQIRKHETDKY